MPCWWDLSMGTQILQEMTVAASIASLVNVPTQ